MIRPFIAVLLLATAASAFGADPAPATTSSTTTAVSSVDSDSRQTRDELRALLHRYPSQVGTVLKIDPALFGNQQYLANYPALAQFIGRHPEVAHNTDFFLEGVAGAGYQDPDSPGFRMWRELLGDLGGFAAFLVITGVFIWAIRTLIEQRRWSRLSRIQTEVHSKLLDRFTSNEELLAYIQTPSGRRFLESAPIPLEAGPRPISAPFSRIFFSVQMGLVAMAVGLGFDLVSMRVPPDVAQPLYGVGVIALLVGLAFVISAVVFYVLSRRFGLFTLPGAAAPGSDE